MAGFIESPSQQQTNPTWSKKTEAVTQTPPPRPNRRIQAAIFRRGKGKSLDPSSNRPKNVCDGFLGEAKSFFFYFLTHHHFDESIARNALQSRPAGAKSMPMDLDL